MQNMAWLGWCIATNHCFDRYRFNHQTFALHQKGEALLIGTFKGRFNLPQITKRDDQCGVRAFVFNMDALMNRYLALPYLLTLQFGLRCRRQSLQRHMHGL